MKISTATSVFANYMLEDAVEAVCALGFDGVDVWCGRPHMYRHDCSEKRLTAVKALLEQKHAQAVTAMPAFFRYPYSLSSPSDAIRSDSMDYVRECIDNAFCVGAKNVLIVPGNAVYAQTRDDAKKLFMNAVALLAQYAEQKGIRLGVEMLYSKLSCYMCSWRDALSLIKDIGSPCLGVVADTGHIKLSGEDFERTVCELGDKLIELHVNDNDGVSQINAVPGHGCIDFKAAADVLKSVGYDGYITLELGWQYSFDPIPPVKEALKYTRDMFC